MTSNKPEVAGFISEIGIKKLREDEYTGDWTLYAWPVRNSTTPLIRLSDYEALQAECEKMRKEAERIEWLEEQTKKSRTGISFDCHRYAEDGYVVNHGYRFMRRHFASGFKDSLRKAIDAAMEKNK